MTSYGMEYPFGQLRSAVLAMSPPSLSCTPSLLAGRAGLAGGQRKGQTACSGATQALNLIAFRHSSSLDHSSFNRIRSQKLNHSEFTCQSSTYLSCLCALHSAVSLACNAVKQILL
ncbi:tumor necrosis factor ligand superfamily member 13B [Grus japonensis]|uniref:Tumor necrosis factor ligand superfamily member 13B n=1 Tax=Grus japonensis TaxID=30415 RepID=A0ABC9X8D2_GRUJA